MIYEPALRDTLLLCLLWLLYFSIHSILASLPVKNWISMRFSQVMPYYRISYNLLATLLLAPPLWVLYTGKSVPLWHFTGIGLWVTNSMALIVLIAFLISMKYYDGSEFLGLRQIRDQETRVEDQENLHISPFHRHVRHPWYFFALVLIWTRSMDSLMLTTAIFITSYFIVGSRLEDKKLIHYYGSPYRRYCGMVAALFPLPWKFITREQAQALVNDSKTTSGR